jgi:hypothetical protein
MPIHGPAHLRIQTFECLANSIRLFRRTHGRRCIVIDRPHIVGGQKATNYYCYCVVSTEDFTIEFNHLDIQVEIEKQYIDRYYLISLTAT